MDKYRTYTAWHTIALFTVWEATVIGCVLASDCHYRRRYPVMAGLAATAALAAIPYIYRRRRRTNQGGLMYPHIREEWAEALYSGIYPQSKFHLEDSCGFTPLGVLCHLAWRRGYLARGLGAQGIVEYRTIPIAWWQPVALDAQTLVLPAGVMAWSGITERDPLVYDVAGWPEIYLSALANGAGWPLDRLAEVILSQRRGSLAPTQQVVPTPPPRFGLSPDAVSPNTVIGASG
jgi:hypothetical protein